MFDLHRTAAALLHPNRPPLRPDILTTEDALNEERRLLQCGGAIEGSSTALCLSGGGIRSAAFGLGVLQALARGRLLRQFDYLSTVSGGGFIGGWLQMAIRERDGVAQAEAALGDPHMPEVGRLRSYTNYLTPQVGVFTEDTWTAIALYLRNLLLNWLVIIPILMIVVLGLIMHRTLLATLGRQDILALPALALAFATAMLFLATLQACVRLPSHRPAAGAADEAREYAIPRSVRQIAYLSLGWTLVAPIAIHGLLPPCVGWGRTLLLPLCYAAAMLGGYAVAWFRQRSDADISALFRVNGGAWLIATIIASLALVLAECWYLHLRPEDKAQALTTFAPLALTLSHMAQVVIHVGLRQERLFADLDREWLARLDGIILLYGLSWCVLCLCCLDLAGLAIPATAEGSRTTWAVGIATVVSGPSVAWIGKQVFSGVEAGLGGRSTMGLTIGRLLQVLSSIFAIGLLAILGVALQYLLGFVQVGLEITGGGIGAYLAVLLIQIGLAVVLFGVSHAFGSVDVNRFSLHGVYRNRLSRAFLGSVLRDRKPEPFTGFGPIENPALAEFGRRFSTAADCKLFPVVNIALNLTRVTHTAWAERMAASFTATPLHCGSAELQNPNDIGERNRDAKGAFVRTTEFAGKTSQFDGAAEHRGLRLGTALTISGAALSPNWGYHSSPSTAFLMTMFNVRLGAWLPNPAVATEQGLRLARPRNSHAAIFEELLGRATDRRQSMYLSDGGHFDNLGIYEMLRRRCSRILVVDAGEDHACIFADLGAAIRKAEIDNLGRIEMGPIQIVARTAIEEGKVSFTPVGFAAGRVHYQDGGVGEILYLKPSFLAGIPAEIRAYGEAHPDFPHESTGDQWFTESQFESYRALGAWQMAQLVEQIPEDDADPLAALFRHARTIATSEGRHNVVSTATVQDPS
jgi:hypothetical protein